MTDRATPEKDAPADPVVVWECGPHANAWKGHDARCRRVHSRTCPCPVCVFPSGDDHATPCHVHDYLDGDGFAYCQECTEATGDYVACRGDGAADAGHRLPEAPPSVR